MVLVGSTTTEHDGARPRLWDCGIVGFPAMAVIRRCQDERHGRWRWTPRLSALARGRAQQPPQLGEQLLEKGRNRPVEEGALVHPIH